MGLPWRIHPVTIQQVVVVVVLRLLLLLLHFHSCRPLVYQFTSVISVVAVVTAFRRNRVFADRRG